MALNTWLLFVLVSLVPVISPGPGIFLGLSNALRYGAHATVFSSMGNACGLVILGYLAAFGMGALMASSALLFTVLKVAGGMYLVYLGVKALRDKSFLQYDPNAPVKQRSKRYFFTQAFFVSLSNPKAIVILAALIPSFMTPLQSYGHYNLLEISILTITYATMCLLFHWLIALSAGRARRLLSSPSRVKIVRRITGTGFIGFGVALATASR
jgi:threonine/homoserine/homoserine lactone efflux protein